MAALTLLAGTPAPTFTGMIGAARAVTLHRYGLLLDEADSPPPRGCGTA